MTNINRDPSRELYPPQVQAMINNDKPGKNMKTYEQHRYRHVELHRAFDELLADWICETESLPSKSTVMDLFNWSHEQTEHPSDKKGKFLPPISSNI